MKNKQYTSLNNVFQAEVTLDEKNSGNNEKQTNNTHHQTMHSKLR